LIAALNGAARKQGLPRFFMSRPSCRFRFRHRIGWIIEPRIAERCAEEDEMDAPYLFAEQVREKFP
jgi:hypothetical protein